MAEGNTSTGDPVVAVGLLLAVAGLETVLQTFGVAVLFGPLVC